MSPKAAREWRRAVARNLGITRPNRLQRDLLKHLTVLREMADTAKTAEKRAEAIVRYGRTVDRLMSRGLRHR